MDESKLNVNEKILSEVAKILNISEEDLSKLLAQLNLNPIDLLEKNNLNNLLTLNFMLNKPEELINVAGIADIMKEIDLKLNEIEQNAETVKVILNDDLSKADQDEVLDESSYLKSQPNDDAELDLNLNLSNDSDKTKTESKENAGSSFADTPRDKNPQQQAFINNINIVDATNEIDSSIITNTDTMNLNKTLEPASIKNKLNNINPKGLDILKQINENIKVQFKGDTSEIRITLNPEKLGDVTLKIATINGIIVAEFIAESERIKEIIESNFNVLKDSLEERGIQVAGLSVSVGEENKQDTMQKFLQEQRKSRLRASKIAADMIAEDINVEEEIDLIDHMESKINYTV